MRQSHRLLPDEDPSRVQKFLYLSQTFGLFGSLWDACSAPPGIARDFCWNCRRRIEISLRQQISPAIGESKLISQIRRAQMLQGPRLDASSLLTRYFETLLSPLSESFPSSFFCCRTRSTGSKDLRADQVHREGCSMPVGWCCPRPVCTLQRSFQSMESRQSL